MTQMRRWTCPNQNCHGQQSVNAPSKPRRDDVRRYCLSCSAKTGRLVQRVCLAAEKKRQDREEKRRQKASQEAARAESKKLVTAITQKEGETFAGIHIPTVVPKFWSALRAVALEMGCTPARTSIPPVRMRRRSDAEACVATGHGGPSRGVRLFIGSNADAAVVQSLVLHELCHAMLGRVDGKAGGWHGPTFSKVLMAAAKKLWGVEVSYVIGAGRCYILDDLINVELRKHLGLPPGPTPWIDRQRRLRNDRVARNRQLKEVVASMNGSVDPPAT